MRFYRQSIDNSEPNKVFSIILEARHWQPGLCSFFHVGPESCLSCLVRALVSRARQALEQSNKFGAFKRSSRRDGIMMGRQEKYNIARPT